QENRRNIARRRRRRIRFYLRDASVNAIMKTTTFMHDHQLTGDWKGTHLRLRPANKTSKVSSHLA
ncbi:hypothetical protein L9F63_025887, partial [Diploptera punctata]